MLACAMLLAGAIALGRVGGAPAQDLQSALDQKRAQLQEAEAQEGVLSTTIERYSNQIETLAGQVATLRNREAAVQADLDAAEAQLERDRARLEVLRNRLHRSIQVLRDRLVAIYRSDEPDVVSVILDSKGFDDLVSRYEYLRVIERRDTAIVGRVRGLRDEMRETVDRVRALRDELAAKRAELARTRGELESRQGALDTARARKRDALSEVQATEERLEGDIGNLEAQIQAQLAAAQSSSTPLPAGPVSGESAAGLIWPVNGPVSSPFGWRWGRMHEGIDIAVPAGTPIRAAASGVVVIAAYTGGYGNYTCIDHGGGLATCYAHQSSYASSVGDHVSQGQVIGYVGCTGSCYGDHLHFEVRLSGQAVDPLGYL